MLWIRIRIKVISWIRIRISIKVKSSIWIRIRINLQMTSQKNVWNMSLFEHFSKVLSLSLEVKIWIRIRMTSRKRIRIKMKSRIRMRSRWCGSALNRLLPSGGLKYYDPRRTMNTRDQWFRRPDIRHKILKGDEILRPVLKNRFPKYSNIEWLLAFWTFLVH